MNARQRANFHKFVGPVELKTKGIVPVSETDAYYLREEGYSAACQDEAEAVKGLVEALLMAIRQNSHDMLMTGDELRACEAAIKAWKGE